MAKMEALFLGHHDLARNGLAGTCTQNMLPKTKLETAIVAASSHPTYKQGGSPSFLPLPCLCEGYLCEISSSIEVPQASVIGISQFIIVKCNKAEEVGVCFVQATLSSMSCHVNLLVVSHYYTTLDIAGQGFLQIGFAKRAKSLRTRATDTKANPSWVFYVAIPWFPIDQVDKVGVLMTIPTSGDVYSPMVERVLLCSWHILVGKPQPTWMSVRSLSCIKLTQVQHMSSTIEPTYFFIIQRGGGRTRRRRRLEEIGGGFCPFRDMLQRVDGNLMAVDESAVCTFGIEDLEVTSLFILFNLERSNQALAPGERRLELPKTL